MKTKKQKQVQKIIKQAEDWAERKRKQGWTRKDFRAGLIHLLFKY